jgi:hypothetical protein
MVKRIAVKILAALMLCTGVFAQNKSEATPLLSKPFWLNYSLAFFQGCQPKILSGNIIFSEDSCFENRREMDDTRFLKGTKVKIYSVHRGQGFTIITFRNWPEIYELKAEYKILLRSRSAKDFRTSFNLLFSAKEVEVEPCLGNVETKSQVRKCFGFPFHISKVRGVEEYEYSSWLVGFSYGGYHSWTVKIKHDKVIEISGSI